MSPARRGRDADPTPLEWLRDLALALLCAAVLAGALLLAALALAHLATSVRPGA